MNDIITLVIIAVICVSIGIALGNLFTGLFGGKKQSRPKAVEKNPNLVEAVRLWRDRRKERIIPEMDGQVFSVPAELSEEQRVRLAQVVVDLRAWLMPAASPERSARAPTPSRPNPAAGAPSSPQSEPRSGLNPVNVLSWALQPGGSKPAAQEKSIAAQIDEILQEKLENSPLKERAIRLMELPGKGMVVMIGLDQYDGVASVPDPEIRNLIRQCVAEWEKRVDVE